MNNLLDNFNSIKELPEDKKYTILIYKLINYYAKKNQIKIEDIIIEDEQFPDIINGKTEITNFIKNYDNWKNPKIKKKHSEIILEVLNNENTESFLEILFWIIMIKKFKKKYTEKLENLRSNLIEIYPKILIKFKKIKENLFNNYYFYICYIIHNFYINIFKWNQDLFDNKFILDCYFITNFELNGINVSNNFIKTILNDNFNKKTLNQIWDKNSTNMTGEIKNNSVFDTIFSINKEKIDEIFKNNNLLENDYEELSNFSNELSKNLKGFSNFNNKSKKIYNDIDNKIHKNLHVIKDLKDLIFMNKSKLCEKLNIDLDEFSESSLVYSKKNIKNVESKKNTISENKLPKINLNYNKLSNPLKNNKYLSKCQINNFSKKKISYSLKGINKKKNLIMFNNDLIDKEMAKEKYNSYKKKIEKKKSFIESIKKNKIYSNIMDNYNIDPNLKNKFLEFGLIKGVLDNYGENNLNSVDNYLKEKQKLKKHIYSDFNPSKNIYNSVDNISEILNNLKNKNDLKFKNNIWSVNKKFNEKKINLNMKNIFLKSKKKLDISKNNRIINIKKNEDLKEKMVKKNKIEYIDNSKNYIKKFLPFIK